MRFIAILIGILAVTGAKAHDDAQWIQEGMYSDYNRAHCCGVEDCNIISSKEVKRTPTGWLWLGREFVDESEGLYNSIDNNWWGCKRPDDTYKIIPRCLFFPTGGV